MLRLLFVIGLNLLCSLQMNAQTVQWINKSSSGNVPNFQNNYTVDDSNCIIHLFNAISTSRVSLFGDTIGPYSTNRNFGMVKVNPDGTSNWNLVFSGLNGSTSFSLRSIGTDGLNYYLLYSSLDTFVVRKNNVVTDTILQARNLRDLNLLKISNTGEIQWRRTIKSLSNVNASPSVLLSYDRQSKTVRFGVGVFDSVLIDKDAGSTMKYVSDKNYRSIKCGSSGAASTIFLAYSDGGELKKFRVLKNDLAVGFSNHSYQANMVFVSGCDTALIDGVIIRPSNHNYFALDSGLRLRLLANIPVFPYTYIRFVRGESISVSSRSEFFLYTASQIGDSLKLGGKSIFHKPFEVITYDQSDAIIKKRTIFPFTSADSVRINYEFHSISSDFVYLTVRGFNASKFNKSFLLDGISYSLNPNSQFSSFIKLDKLLNVLWININFIPNATPPNYERLGVDKEGNLIFNGFTNGQNVFAVLNDSLPKTGSTYTFVVKVRDQTITRGAVSKGPYCAGDTLLVPYSITGVFNSSNQFIAQLSNEDGSFDDTSKIFELGRIKSTENSTIKGRLPLFQVKSSANYRIRIISTSPPVQSFFKLDSLRLLIFSKDKADPGPGLTICSGDTVTLNTFGGTRWRWFPGDMTSDSMARSTKTAPRRTTLFTIIISDSSGCGLPDTAEKLIVVREKPQIRLADTAITVCLNAQVEIHAAFYGGDSARYKNTWFKVNESNNWITLDSGTGVWTDTLNYKLTDAERDSVVIAVLLSDNCYPKTDTAFFVININRQKPEIKFEKTDTAICPGADVDIKMKFLNGDSSSAWRWQWKVIQNNTVVFTDSATGADSTSGKILFESDFSGSKKLWIIAQNLCSPMVDSASMTFVAREKLSAFILQKDTILCTGNSLKLDARATGGKPESHKFNWLYNNAILSDSNSVLILSDSSVQIQLVVSDNCMPKNDTAVYNLQVRDRLVLKQGNFKDSILCFGQKLQLNALPSGGDTANYSFSWKVNEVLTSSDKSFLYNSTDYLSSGDTNSRKFNIRLQLSDNCSINVDSVNWQITVLPGLRLKASYKDSICFGSRDSVALTVKGGSGFYNYSWRNGQNQLIGFNSFIIVNHTNPALTGKVSYKVNVNDGCTVFGDSIEVLQSLLDPLSLIITTNDTCHSGTALLNSSLSGGKSQSRIVDWFDENGFIATNSGSLSYSSDKVTTIRAIAKDGCSLNTDTSYIRISPFPDADIIFPAETFCEPASVPFTVRNTGTTSFNYILTFGDGIQTGLKSLPDSLTEHLYSKAGQYSASLVLTNSYNCRSSMISAPISVFPRPQSFFSWSPNIPTIDDSVVLLTNLSQNAVTYIWNFPGGASSNIVSPEFKFTDTGSYNIQLIAVSDKNCKDTTENIIRVNSNFKIFIPDVFTPDGDGVNDIWLPQGTAIGLIEFEVYNRWGQMIFKGNADKGWDGRDGSAKAMQGVYVYKLKVKGQFGGLYYLSGVMHLLR